MSIYLDKEYNDAISSDYRRAIAVAVTVAQMNGIDIFLIGGVVRDLILDNPIKDIDIAVQGDAIDFAHKLSPFCRKRRHIISIYYYHIKKLLVTGRIGIT